MLGIREDSRGDDGHFLLPLNEVGHAAFFRRSLDVEEPRETFLFKDRTVEREGGG